MAITCGADGAVLARIGTIVEQPAIPILVVDTVGAGDAFLGALVAGWVEGKDDQYALRMASAAGALAATGTGAFNSLPDRATLEAFLRDKG